jgi:hypothetical protein
VSYITGAIKWSSPNSDQFQVLHAPLFCFLASPGSIHATD